MVNVKTSIVLSAGMTALIEATTGIILLTSPWVNYPVGYTTNFKLKTETMKQEVCTWSTLYIRANFGLGKQNETSLGSPHSHGIVWSLVSPRSFLSACF